MPEYLLPRIKMRFDNFEKAKEFYNRYARHSGFGIKIGQHNGNNRYLQCTREGKYKPTIAEPERQRMNSRDVHTIFAMYLFPTVATSAFFMDLCIHFSFG